MAANFAKLPELVRRGMSNGAEPGGDLLAARRLTAAFRRRGRQMR